jgi:two-component sensor histidine kinase
MTLKSPPGPVVHELAADAADLTGVRRSVRRQLCAWGRADLADAAQLCVTELLTNVLRHAGSPMCELRLEYDELDGCGLGGRGLGAGLDAGPCGPDGDLGAGLGGPGGGGPGGPGGDLSGGAAVVRLSVSDTSHVLPVRAPVPDWTAERGRGLNLINATAYRWGSVLTATGKTVWVELR